MSLASLTWISLSFPFDSLTLYSKSLERCNLSLQSLSQRVDRLPSLTLHSLSLATGILQSLIFDSWSFAIASLILYSLSFAKDRLQHLTLQSLSLEDENGFEPLSFKEVSFDEGTEELAKSLDNPRMKRRAETSSLSKLSFEQRKRAKEAETNSFLPSLSKRNLSLRMCLRIFLLGSFHLGYAALFFENGSFKISFSNWSLQPDQLVAACSNSSVCFPLLSCKGGCFGLVFVLHFFCLIAWRRRFFELLSGASVPHHRPLTAGKPLVIASQPAPPQCASCKGAFKGGRHGCQRKVLGHGNPLTFLSGKCCKFQGFALRDTLRDALRVALRDPFAPFFTGCLPGTTCKPSLRDAIFKGGKLGKEAICLIFWVCLVPAQLPEMVG